MPIDPTTSTVHSRLRRWLRRCAWALAALAALIALAWLAVPPLARGQIETRLTAALGRPTSVEAVAFNPFNLRLTVRKLAVAGGASGAPLLAFDELIADLSYASLWHRAPVLDALVLVRPVISLGRDAAGRYSVQDIVDKAAVDSGTPAPRFSLNNIEVVDATIAFDDGRTGRAHRIEHLAVGIPFLSSLPYQTDITVTPRLEGTFDGTHFAAHGRTVPFATRREGTIALDVDALPLADYVAYLPVKPRVAVAGGTLTTRLALVFVESGSGERMLELRGEARVDRLAVNRRDGSPLVAAQRIAVALDRADLLGQDVRVASLAIDGPRVDLKRLADGTLEFAHPMFDLPSASAAPPADTPAPSADIREHAWQLTVAHAAVRDGALSIVDESSAFRTSLTDVAVDVTNLSTLPERKAHATAQFVSGDRVAAFKAEADISPRGPAAEGRFELTRFSLGLLFPYYKDALGVDVQKGALDLAAHFSLAADGNLKLGQGTGSISDLTLAYPQAKQPFWRNPALSAAGIDVDVVARKVSIAQLRSQGATIRLARQRDGSLDFARIVKTTKTTGIVDDEQTWTLAVGKLDIERAAIDLEDREPEPAVRMALRDFALSASNVTNARGARSAITVRARVEPRGRIAFSGPVSTNPVFVAGRLDAGGIDLGALRPYLERHVDVTFTGGTLAAAGSLAVEVSERDSVKAGWKGNVTVTDFAALDKPTASELLRWKRLALEDVDIATQPLHAGVGRIVADDFFARVIVNPDGTLNLTRVLATERAHEGSPVPAGNPATGARPAPDGTWPITIGRIELARGHVNLSDYFVRPNYSADLTDVAGTVTTMSADKAGDVAINARVNGTAPVEVAGRIHPFGSELALDIAAKARDVDLPQLTPYSVKYAGYGIERGKLTFDVHYRVEKRTLSAENRLVLDQLTFNPQHVESATATKLPVLLAVALLKDAHGVIDIQLPVSGSLDDPEFSVGGLVVRVIVNLIAKAVTAPFALLSAAFGKGEELSTVPFAPGVAAPGPEAQQRLDTLGKALAERPGLRLDIAGRADPGADRDALRRAAVETALKREKFRTLAAAGAAPASVDLVTISSDERARWLAAAYREAPIATRPRNAVGMLRDLPPAEMEDILLSATAVDDDALRLLANARSASVKEALAAKGIPGERLFVSASRIADDAPSGSPSATAPEVSRSGSRVDLTLR